MDTTRQGADLAMERRLEISDGGHAACAVGLALGRPNDEVQHTVRVLLEWARENHQEWFYRFEPPAAPARETLHPVRAEERPALDAEPLPPRHSPIF